MSDLVGNHIVGFPTRRLIFSHKLVNMRYFQRNMFSVWILLFFLDQTAITCTNWTYFLNES